MKFNGWYRLWIFLSAIYFILVASYVILNFPKAENIPHQAEFYKKLSKKSAAMISPQRTAQSFVDQALGTKSLNFHPIIEMPNKHIIEFEAKLSEEDMKIASQEYWRIVEQKASEKRRHLLFYAFLFWLVPCLVLYALGRSINWVYEPQQPHRMFFFTFLYFTLLTVIVLIILRVLLEY